MPFNSRGARGAFARLCLSILIPALSLLARQATQQPAPTNTPADFEAARQKAEDELKSARSLLGTSGALRNAADAASSSLKSTVAARQADGSALRVLTSEDTALQSLLDGKVVDSLSKAGGNAGDEAKKLTPLKANLDSLKGGKDFAALPAVTQAQFSQTLADCQTVIDQLGKDPDLDTQSASALQAVLAQVIVQAKEVTQKWVDALKALGDTVATPLTDSAKLAKLLGTNLPALADVATLRGPYGDKWAAVSAKLALLLQPGTTLPATADNVKANLDSLNGTNAASGSVQTISGAIAGWLKTLQALAMTEAQAVATLSTQVDSDPPSYTPSGLAEVHKATDIHDSIQAVADAVARLLPLADKLASPGHPFPVDDVTTAIASMNGSNQALNGAAARLGESISGDRSQFDADQMPLYYFTDVPRLIRMLSPAAYEIGGIQGAQAQAEAARQKLAEAELQLTAAAADVNSYQTRLMQLPTELKQARANARSQDQAYSKTANRLSGLTDQLSAATDRYTTASSAAKAAPTDRAAQLELQNSQQDKNRLSAQTASAQTDNANALHDKDVADQKLQAAEDEQTGIPAQIAQAKIALEAAQNNVSQRRQESLLAATAESDAFALARDNTPYWFAPATGDSKDAARRVEMFGTDDSKIIYLRGKRADLDEVMNIIAKIDEASPQARITLWSLQLNYTNDAKGHAVSQLNDALKKSEDTLAEIRFQMAQAVSLFRDSVNAQLSEVTKDSTCKTAAECRLDRIRKFYSPQVLLQLGDTAEDSRPKSGSDPFTELSTWTVPDPAGTTTLGEALMIMSLARPEIRKKVFDKFADSFKKTKRPPWTAADGEEVGQLFKSLSRVLDIDLSASDDAKTELTSAQLEIVHALQSIRNTGPRMLDRLRSLIEQLGNSSDQMQALCKQIAEIDLSLIFRPQSAPLATPPPCATYSPPPVIGTLTSPDPTSVLEARRREVDGKIFSKYGDILGLSEGIGPLYWYLTQHFVIPSEILALYPDQASLSFGLGNDAAERTRLIGAASHVQVQLETKALILARAREAAADEMLKELMTAMEDDLDRQFVRPGLAKLRGDILGQGNLQVGILQRTSILATNRLVARVDPRASAQLALGDQEDILQSLTQLGQIYLAAQSGGVLGTLSALKNLQGQTQEPPQEIYGLSTGSQFKVTPIFDPTGQALRFKFDYVAANNVLEPNGTMNPQLPRIERHTVNTEVQISNMELREISRYEANSKLGLPTTYSGGIPLLKDIPYVRPVPLIGWFVRKGGSGAVSQESLLFGQTAIYPAIEEITDLLTGDVPASLGAAASTKPN